MYRVNLDEYVVGYESLHEQAKRVQFAASVHKLRAKFMGHRSDLVQLRIWLISSTSRGGGVAEMLPRIMALMRELQMKVEWLIINTDNPSDKARFFSLTKHMHNLLHGDGVPLEQWGGWGLEHLPFAHKRNTSANELLPSTGENIGAGGPLNHVARLRELYEAVNLENAERFFSEFCTDPHPDRDVVIVHDLQPCSIVREIKRRFPTMPCIWRCHIGVDTKNAATESGWSFLRQYLQEYDTLVFSTKEYIQPEFSHKSVVVTPGLAPLAPKNKELSPYEVTQLLMRAGLMDFQQTYILEQHGCGLIDPPFDHRAKIYKSRPSTTNIASSSSGSGTTAILQGVGEEEDQQQRLYPPSDLDESAPASAAASSSPTTITNIGLPLSPASTCSSDDETASTVSSITSPSGNENHLTSASSPLPPPPLHFSSTTCNAITTGAPSSAAAAAADTTTTPPTIPLPRTRLSTLPGIVENKTVVSSIQPQPPLPSSSSSSTTTTTTVPAHQHDPRRSSHCTCTLCISSLEGIPFLHRPIIAQISRWDRLKGWKPLLEAWKEIKMNMDLYANESQDLMTPSSETVHDVGRHRRVLENSLLVLCGPNPAYIQDDPEGLEVLREIKIQYDRLPPIVQRDVKIVQLPMSSIVENALIVNAIQRAAMIIVQNSLREGYGLTCAEGMLKRTAVIGTEQAVGLRTQITHGVDGILVQGSPENPLNVAKAINMLLGNDVLREEVAVNAQKKATDNFLIYTQMEQWLNLVVKMIDTRKMIRLSGTDESQVYMGGISISAGGGGAGGEGVGLFEGSTTTRSASTQTVTGPIEPVEG